MQLNGLFSLKDAIAVAAWQKSYECRELNGPSPGKERVSSSNVGILQTLLFYQHFYKLSLVTFCMLEGERTENIFRYGERENLPRPKSGMVAGEDVD